MKKVRRIAVLILTVIILLLSACASKEDSKSEKDSENLAMEADNERTDSQTEKDVEKSHTKTSGADENADGTSEGEGTSSPDTAAGTGSDTGNRQTSAQTDTSSEGDTVKNNSTSESQKSENTQTSASIQASVEAQTAAPVKEETSTTASAVEQTSASAATMCGINVSAKASNAASAIAEAITNPSMSEFDKVKAIHDYIVANVNYPSVIDYNNMSLFTAEGALVNKLAVCQGYAEAFALLCYKAGIQAEMVYGTATNSLGTESHAWNLVRVDGVWYQMDVTWDDPVGGDTADGANMQYNYFLIPDSIMNKNHVGQSYTKQYSCTSSKYVEYGKQLSAQVLIKSNYGNIQYDFASNESEVKSIAANNKNSGINTYVIAYNLGWVYENTQTAYSGVETAFNNIANWVGNTAMKSVSASVLYGEGMQYIIVKLTVGQ